MSHFNFPQQLSSEDLQQQAAQRRHNGFRNDDTPSMAMALQNQGQMMDMVNMMGGDSLDDIIMQNSRDMQRQSFSNPYGGETTDAHGRPTNMLEFGSRDGNLNGFQFGTSGADVQNVSNRRPSPGNMDVSLGYGALSGNLGFNNQSYSGPMQMNSLQIDTSGSFDMSTDMMGNMMSYSEMGDPASMNSIFGPSTYSDPYTSNMSDFAMPMAMDDVTSSQDLPSAELEAPRAEQPTQRPKNTLQRHLSANKLETSSVSTMYSPQTAKDKRSASESEILNPAQPVVAFQHTSTHSSDADQVAVVEAETEGTTAKGPSFSNVYSSSGFDMLSILMRVATRKNPEIDIGAVDMSCAFVVCDVTQNDCPIIYVSDIFERLTGYNKHEVLGRNCRFLQAPDGKVTPGVKRKYVDDDSVWYLKSRIKAHRESQRSLINYRKGGQPFMNLLTLIPIPWDNSDEIRYIVGFQVDLVERPSSVAGKSTSGSYSVNYQQGTLPRYVWEPPDSVRHLQESGQTISRDDVSQVLQNFNSSSDSEITKRMWDKVLLENTDDVVHVLSLKGLFLYLSPSSRHVLEYDSSELVGTALSSVCHPSDIVPVTRELKDTSTGATVNVVFRIRRKISGYTWFESHGSLCVDQGKGRKCIILVGRERPVYALSRHDIDSAGGIGENEMWAKLSTSGMILFISSNTRMLLDRQPEDLVGTSVQALMRPESKLEFGRILERARTGKRVNFKHEIIHKRGQVLQAHTTLYPGDAAEGSKPTFLVGQLRLIKSSSSSSTSRNASLQLTAAFPATANATKRPALKTQTSQQSAGDGGSDISPPHDNWTDGNNGGGATPTSTASSSKEYIMTQAGSAGLVIGTQDAALASEDNIFDELKTTRCTSWQFELRQMEKSNRLLAEELASLLSSKKKRKRRKGAGHLQRDCANCHTRVTPEWRRGPSGNRDLCNSCGLRWAKQQGRVSPRNSSSKEGGSKKGSASPSHSVSSPVQKDFNQQNATTNPSNNPSTSNTKAAAAANQVPLSPNNVARDATNLNTHPNPQSTNVMGGDLSASSGKDRRGTQESKPIHAPSVGFLDGGPNSITKIEEQPEPS